MFGYANELYLIHKNGSVSTTINTCVPTKIRLFENYDYFIEELEEEEAKKLERIKILEEKRKQEEKRRIEKQNQMAEYREKGVCQYCGSEFKSGIFGSKCVKCGRKKDY